MNRQHLRQIILILVGTALFMAGAQAHSQHPPQLEPAVKTRFDEEAISIPFPQRDVHVVEQSFS